MPQRPSVSAIAARRNGAWGVLLLSNGAEHFLPWADARALVREMRQCCDVIERQHPAEVQP